MVQPGLTKTDKEPQSSCVILRKGRFHTMSRDINCSVGSGLPEDMTAAVPAAKLIPLLDQLPDDELEVSLDSDFFHLKAKSRRKTRIAAEAKILLPVTEVSLPAKDAWEELDEEFGEAVKIVKGCTSKTGEYLQQCIHMTPDWLEATDNTKMVRYKLPTPAPHPLLIRGHVLNSMTQMGMTKAAFTPGWLHFRNPVGLRMSLRCDEPVEPYPNLDQILALRGEQIIFPKALSKAAERAGLFADKDVQIKLTETDLLVRGMDVLGDHTEACEMDYRGRPMSFTIPHKLLVDLVEQHPNCEITEHCLRVNGGNFVYATSLDMEAREIE
jgi:hypothetical protein